MGASWVEATMRTSGFDTARRFFVDTVQVQYSSRACFTLSWPDFATCFNVPAIY